MEIFHLENKKYVTSCPECSEILKFKIDKKTMSISGECKNGHSVENETIEFFINNCIKSTNEYYNKCYNCYELINDEFNNFICLRCDKLFCKNCINIHKQKEKHNIRKNFITDSHICRKHERKYLWFCETCRINLCQECKKFHVFHSIKSFLDVIPTTKEKESINNNIEKLNNYIEELYLLNDKILEDTRIRCKKFSQFLKFLEEISDKLFKNYNSSFFDYYNFENIKYISDLINDRDFYNFDKYFDYLQCGLTLKIDENIIKNNKIKIKEKLVLENLNYYKDNLFISHKDKFIYLYEYENFNFKQIMKYDFISIGKIDSIKPAKYSDNILINFKLKKNIKILDYDNDNKTLKLGKEEIRCVRAYPMKNFSDFIDNKNGNIITIDNIGELNIWKKNIKKKYYELDTIIIGEYKNIFNINDSLFGCQDKNELIKIFYIDKINCIKNINFKCNSTFIGNLENKLIIFNSYSRNQIFLVDLKHLELVQILPMNKLIFSTLIKNNYSVRIKNNYLLLFYIDENELIRIKKKCYNPEKKMFNNEEVIETKIKFSIVPEVLVTNNDYMVLSDKNTFILIKL